MQNPLISAFAVVTLLSGCAALTPPAQEHPLDSTKEHWFDYDATRRGVVMVPGKVTIKMCAEPSPDAALNLVSKLRANTGAGNVGGTAELNTSVVELAGRTQMVLFLREALYRLCEQSLNQQFTKEEVLSAYTKVIDTALEMAKADQHKAQEAALKAKGAAAKALQDLTPEQRFQLLR